MCDKGMIVPAMLIFGVVYNLLAAILFLLGLSLGGNERATEAFAGVNVQAANTLIFISFILVPLSCIGAYGARAHNKFCLSGYLAVTILIMMTLWGVGTTLLTAASSDFSDDEQYKCLHYQRPDDTVDDELCLRYFRDGLVQRLRTMWLSMHQLVVENNKEIKTLLVKMQQGRVSGPMCCGFLRPGYCVGESGETCGMEGLLEAPERMYEPTIVCRTGEDTPEAGGCKFDFPIGVCGYDRLREDSVGCAYTIKLWIENQMVVAGLIVQIVSIIPGISSLYSCCMCLKRKHADVLPTKYIQSGGGV